MRTLSLRLDDQTDALLRAYCARTGVSQTEAVKSGIAALVATTSPPAQIAEALGLVGCFDSGIGDLGRNHAQRLRDSASTACPAGKGSTTCWATFE
ncbi:hypothetical protein ACCAA_600013 [Candidatus Accumulibacter aalborgensis]|uniref:Ribbon-helix-helix protein CopG domain-containing protein n=1 Tax=Candidatus Accumulibacter aalborgensis TaxID=1860102 RepID=A0A1A8XV97_9PROT|nr:hypothetical protein [Candidatus Accumulibacter aalborgensis]SBT08656.1 hypothetical protein ACCAA_600013 [Candidatus Accumulibacter aalborgensis]